MQANRQGQSFKLELEQITRLRSFAGGPMAMEVDALTKGDGRKGPKGGKGNETRVCWKCGKPGHLAKDCKAGGKGVGGTPKPPSGGKGVGKAKAKALKAAAKAAALAVT